MASYVVIEYVADWAGDGPPPTPAGGDEPHAHTSTPAEFTGTSDITGPPRGDVGISNSPIWRL